MTASLREGQDKSQHGFIQRCPHDEDHPFSVVSHELSRNPSLSFGVRGFLVYLLSFDRAWRVQVSFIVNSQDISKDAAYKMLNECIEAGYIKRVEYLEKGLKRYDYYISERPKFKKCLPCLEKPDTEKPDPEIAYTKEYQEYSLHSYSKEKTIKQEPPSAIASELTDFLLERVKGVNPKFSASTKAWEKHWKQLLKKREIKELKEMIEWVFQHHFWSSVIVGPNALINNLEKIQAGMNVAKSTASNKVNNTVVSMIDAPKNKALAEKIESKFPQHPNHAFNAAPDRCTLICERLKTFDSFKKIHTYPELTYNQPASVFSEQLFSMLRKSGMPDEAIKKLI